MNTLATALFDEISNIPCINSHSHIMPETDRLTDSPDALSFFRHAYAASDLVSAGMSDKAIRTALSPGLPLAERWRIFEPYFRWTRLTGYSQCIIEGFRDLLGFPELTGETVEPISEALREYSKPGFYHEVLKRRSNIELSVVNMEDLVEVDRELFLPLPRLNRFSMLQSVSQVQVIEGDYNVSITNLDEHVEVIRQVCLEWKAAKVAGVKMSQSYHRRMDFKRRPQEDAAKIFDRLMEGDYAGLASEEGVLLEDYLVFECCRAAADADLTIQFHQGIRAGNYGSMEGCSPAPLTELFQTFRDARFDLSHAGYPYLREGAVLGKTFSNVYLNMSWIHIISPIGSRMDLREWLRMVPYNKIIAFGDDLQYVETVYGHLKMARQNFAIALAEMIEEGIISDSVACDVAQAAFHDNPAKIYGLSA
jgi:predicted TIM-barrel fold metal-dependent hydrolase